jgi:hypothetical protein
MELIMSMDSRIPRRFISKQIPITPCVIPFLSFGTTSSKQLVILRSGQTERVVNNESSEIIRIFNSAFNELLPEKYAKRNFYPETLRQEIDSVNDWVYNLFNNGVYKTGFASKQEVCMSLLLALLKMRRGECEGCF